MSPAKKKAEKLNWFDLQGKVKSMTEPELLAMLKEESRGDARLSYIIRIYGRYSSLRRQREMKELLNP
jgi:hypothetical protein